MTGYLYILKHGIGPGTMPKDVEILKVKDLPNYYTAVWLDRFLTTQEMDRYDIPYETEINKYLNWIDYCQTDDGDDVVPCDEIEACGDIMASKKIVASKMSDLDLLAREALECATKDELSGVISGLDSLGLRNLYLHYMEMLKDDSLSVGYIASDLSDTLYNMFSDINACDKVMAALDEGYDVLWAKRDLLIALLKKEINDVLSIRFPDEDNYLAGCYDDGDMIGFQGYDNEKTALYAPTIEEVLKKYKINTLTTSNWDWTGDYIYFRLSDISDESKRLLTDLVSKGIHFSQVNACDKVTASTLSGPEFNKLCDEYASLDPWIPIEEIWDMVNADHGNEDGLADDITAYVEHYRNCMDEGIDPDDIDACDKVEATTKPKYFANMINASEFDSFNDEYGVHRVSKSDLNYVKDSIYERVSKSTDIPFSLNMSITKQMPDAIAKVYIELNNLSDGTKLEYDDRVDSNNLEGTIQRMTKYILALITNNWSEFPDNITDADEERITGDIYDEIETTIFDYYLYGATELLTIYSEEDPTFLYNIETDYSDMPDSLTIDIKLEALDKDDLLGLVHDYLKPITKDYDPKYSIDYSKTGRLGKTGYIHIKFQ